MQFVFVRVISVALFFGFAGTVLLAEEKPEAILAAAKNCPAAAATQSVSMTSLRLSASMAKPLSIANLWRKSPIDEDRDPPGVAQTRAPAFVPPQAAPASAYFPAR